MKKINVLFCLLLIFTITISIGKPQRIAAKEQDLQVEKLREQYIG